MKVLSRLNIKTKAGGPSEETFYKKWSEDQRNSYLKEHPNSRFSKDNKSQEKPVNNKISPKAPKGNERKTSFFDGDLEIGTWQDSPRVGGNYDKDAANIGNLLKKADITDVKYGTDGDKNIISVRNPKNGKLYNVIIDDFGVDIMNEDMNDTVLDFDSTNGNGYFDRYETRSLGRAVTKALKGLGF